MFVFSRGMKLQIWHQVLDMVALCFLCPFCILPSEKQMSKKCRNVKDLGNSVQQWLHLCCKVFNFIIQMSSRFFSLYFSSSLSMLVSFSCSINVNFVFVLKLWPGNRKCWSDWSKFRSFVSFQWLLSLKGCFRFTCVLFVA